MPQYTSRHRIPYPLASERVADYPSTARTAADKIDELLPIVRTGSISQTVGRLTYSTVTVPISPPMPSANYTVILTLSGSGNYAPEQAQVAHIADRNAPNKFEVRFRNNANSSQPLTCNYLIISNS